MIAIVDYGVGNLFSLSSSLAFLGLENVITKEKATLLAADRIILPGVGAFADAMQKLMATGLVGTLMEQAEAGKPLLGICLGMQLLFDKSYEYGETVGLGLIHGNICPMEPAVEPGRKVPHIGWNSLEFEKNSDSKEVGMGTAHPLLKYNRDGDYVYYVHSFYATDCEESILAFSQYGVKIPGVVGSGSVFGTQFHPEKSGTVGLSMLRAFSEL